MGCKANTFRVRFSMTVVKRKLAERGQLTVP
jgi:hypothetical protein